MIVTINIQAQNFVIYIPKTCRLFRKTISSIQQIVFLSSGKNYVTEQGLLCFYNNTPLPELDLFILFIFWMLQGKGLQITLSTLVKKYSMVLDYYVSFSEIIKCRTSILKKKFWHI